MKPEPVDSAPAPELLATARRWLARRDAGLDAIDQAELRRWLAADPAHRRAFAAADLRRTEVDWALRAGAVDELIADLDRRARARRRRRGVLAGAACAAALAFVSITWRQPAPAPARPAAASSLAATGPRSTTLADGSIAELRADAEIDVDYSSGLRRVTLRRGAAHFQVKSDPRRPFVVASRGWEVRAVGTAFAVEAGAEAVAVLVTEGRVSVDRGDASARVYVAAGEHVSVADSATAGSTTPAAMSPEAMQQRLSWRLPLLQFAGTPLAEIVTAMNRHNRVQFQLADAAIGRLQLSGALRADKTAALQAMLESDFALQTERTGDTIHVRRRQ